MKRRYMIGIAFALALSGCGAGTSVLKPIVHVTCDIARAAVAVCPAAEEATSGSP